MERSSAHLEIEGATGPKRVTVLIDDGRQINLAIILRDKYSFSLYRKRLCRCNWSVAQPKQFRQGPTFFIESIIYIQGIKAF